jgi:hypothetical protein
MSKRKPRYQAPEGCPVYFLHRPQIAGPIVLNILYFAWTAKVAKTSQHTPE